MSVLVRQNFEVSLWSNQQNLATEKNDIFFFLSNSDNSQSLMAVPKPKEDNITYFTLLDDIWKKTSSEGTNKQRREGDSDHNAIGCRLNSVKTERS